MKRMFGERWYCCKKRDSRGQIPITERAEVVTHTCLIY